MCNPGIGWPVPHDDPFAVDCGVNERLAPEQVGNARKAHQDVTHLLMRNCHDCGWNKRAEAVIHNLDKEALQIWSVPHNMEGHDLPFAVGRDFIAARYALQDNAYDRGTVAQTHDVVVRPQLSDC